MKSVPRHVRFSEKDIEDIARFTGQMVGRVVAGERKRYRRQLAALWLAVVAVAVLAVVV